MYTKFFTFAEIEAMPYLPDEILNRPAPSEDEARTKMVSMGQVGLLNTPATIERNGVIHVMDGNRRFAGFKLAIKENYRPFLDRYVDGGMSFAVYTQDEKGDVEILRSQVVGNASIKPQVNSEYAKSLFKILVLSPGMTKEKLASDCGLTLTKLNSILKLNQLDEKAQTLLDAGKMELTNAIALTSIPKANINDELLEKACLNKTVDFANEINNIIEGIREDRKLNKVGSHKKEFVAEAKIKTKEELKTLYAQVEYEFNLDQNDAVNIARMELMKQIFSLDELSLQTAKDAFDKKQKDDEASAVKRKEERNKKKIEDYKKFIAEQEGTSVKDSVAATI
jgi:hypothetical protein